MLLIPAVAAAAALTVSGPRMLEPSEIVEFSPRSLYQQTMEVAERNIAAMQG